MSTKAKAQKLIKDAAKIKKIQEQMQKLHRELYEIQKENDWCRYVGQEFCDMVNDLGIGEECGKAQQTVIYAHRWDD